MPEETEAGAPEVHITAEVSPNAWLAPGVRIWNQVQVREDASIGEDTSVGKNCYVDAGVSIGARCKIQNNVSIFHGVTVEDGVFLGPHVCFTNDRVPRAINPDGSPKGGDDWTVTPTHVAVGASVGAGAIILPGVHLGRFCMVGAGSVVTHYVPDNGLVIGVPARLVGWVCDCGERLAVNQSQPMLSGTASCRTCGREIRVAT